MKGKITAVLFIVVFTLIAAVVVTFLTARDIQPDLVETTEAPSESSGVVVIVPSADVSAPVSTPASTPASTPTATSAPVQTPAPTPTPAATSAPGVSLGSGSFSSDTQAKLNIRADWSAQTSGSGQAEITVKVSLDSYSIHLKAVPNSVNISLGGQYVSLDAPAIEYDGNALLNTVLATKTFTVDLPAGSSKSYTLAVEWQFGGTYGDVSIPVIECGGSIALSR